MADICWPLTGIGIECHRESAAMRMHQLRSLLPRLVGLLAVASSAPPAAALTDHRFDERPGHYAFTATFEVSAEPARVLGLVYDFEHLQRYSRRSQSELLDEGDGWQRVRFTHSGWLWTVRAVVLRELDRPANCVRFRVESASRTGLPIPLPEASNGSFCVVPEAGHVRVVYQQAGEMDSFLPAAAWRRYARAEALAFARDLEDYVRVNLAPRPPPASPPRPLPEAPG